MGTWETSVQDGFDKLDADLRFLVDCLAEVLTEIGEKDLARWLPGQLAAGTKGRLPERGAQAVAVGFQLLNLVEENAAQQALRTRENKLGLLHESGLWGRTLASLRKEGLTARQVLDRLAAQTVEPVLTGHPTEAKRWTVLDQHRQLYLLLLQLENQMFTEAERALIREEIKTVLEQLWRTGEILLTKPDLKSERRNALLYFRDKFPEVLRVLDDRFAQAWEASGYGAEQPLSPTDFPRLRFGSWVGGDRDGHPLVTAEVTAETLQDLHQGALEMLAAQLEALMRPLGLSIHSQTLPASLAEALRQQATAVGAPLAESLAAEHAEEPWRHYVALLRARLPRPDQPTAAQPYRFPSELLADLRRLHASLAEVGAARIARRHVQPLQRLTEVFGFHLASLDVRQNSAFHEKAVAQLLDAAGLSGAAYLAADEAGRRAVLESELQSPRPLAGAESELGREAQAVLDCLRVLAGQIRQRGRAGLGACIVSMTRSLSDLLAVYLLCREAGLLRATPEGPVCLMPVVPLFETIDDLEQSPGILAEFLAHPITRRSLAWQARAFDEAVADPARLRAPLPNGAERQRIQQVMVGYSDSNKDSGILASQWGLHAAQSRLYATAEAAGVQLLVFHGRGGTVSRGAGPTHRFLEALPAGSLRPGLRVTEQGETVAQKFNNRRTAAHNLELLLAGATGASLLAEGRSLDPRLADTLAWLAERSRKAYRTLLEDPDFLGFYRQATPIDVLEQSRIGSRPSRRSGQATLADLRAIPWVFSWNQARFYLPGWFGAGAALQALEQERPEAHALLRKRQDAWPLLRYVLTNIETGLASADAEIMGLYAGLVADPKVRRRLLGVIQTEYTGARTQLAKLLGGDLEARRPRFVKTLRARDAGLALLHREQVRLLQEWRGLKGKEAEAMLPQLLLSVNAIASGLRTTG